MARMNIACEVVLTAIMLVGSTDGAWAQPVQESSANARPNVVLVVIDAFRADRVTAMNHGVPVMPFLAQFAADSRQFTRALSQEAWTKPSMATIYTSLYAGAHGVQSGAKYLLEPEEAPESADALPASIPNMATVLKAAGYDTIGVQTNPNLQERFGFANGFNRYAFLKGTPGMLVTPVVLDALKQAKPPFFLYVHYFDPHAPYLALPPFCEAFGPMPEITPEEDELFRTRQVDVCRDLDRVALGIAGRPVFPPLSDRAKTYLRHCYDVECRLVDDQIREVIAALGTQAQNTLVVITADHGEELWDHGELGHGKTAHGEVLHVPLLFHYPGRLPAKADPAMAGTVDILPSVAGFLGLPVNPAWQGVDLLKARAAGADAVQFSQCKGAFPGFPREYGVAQSGSDKLIIDLKHGTTQLFDTIQDPGETRNLAAAKPERTAELRKRFEEHAARMKEVSATLPHETAALSEETKEAIRALGYLAK